MSPCAVSVFDCVDALDFAPHTIRNKCVFCILRIARSCHRRDFMKDGALACWMGQVIFCATDMKEDL